MATPITVTVLNPNTSQETTAALHRILLEKLLAFHPNPTSAAGAHS